MLRNARGDAWCATHAAVPSCAFCGVPTELVFAGTSRCSMCALHAVDDQPHLRPLVMHLREVLQRRGLKVDAPVHVLFRTQRTLIGSGHLQGPHSFGSTHYTRSAQSGALLGSITIAIQAGLPRARAEHVIAHEWAHAALADRGRGSLPPVLEEGFAEYVARDYLIRDSADPHAAVLVAEMEARHGDPYGDGLQLLQKLVADHGRRKVFSSLVTGKLEDVGMAA